MVPIHKLAIQKTVLFPLQTMQIDESTIAGNMSVMDYLAEHGLPLPRRFFAMPSHTIVGGDHMTVSRLLALKIHRFPERDPYQGLRLVHLTLQLFHLSMTLCSTILKTHFGSPESPGTHASIVVMLDRKRLSKEDQEFRAADELLRIVFDAKMQLLYESLEQKNPSDKLDLQ
ncbi:hypothetical protein BG000_006844, partial [Podila horticola]